jgi:DNA primase
MSGRITSEILGRITISSIAEQLGIRLDRTRRRGVAIWREGIHFSVSFNDDKNLWHDFAANEGGGVIDLIVKVRGDSRKEALQWLADITGVPLGDESDEERKTRARRFSAAKPEAKRFLRWRSESLKLLEAHRQHLMQVYYRAVRFTFYNDGAEHRRRGDIRYELATRTEGRWWAQIEQVDRCIDDLRHQPPLALLRVFRAQNQRG